jgi:hypothetical protein
MLSLLNSYADILANFADNLTVQFPSTGQSTTIWSLLGLFLHDPIVNGRGVQTLEKPPFKQIPAAITDSIAIAFSIPSTSWI